MKNLNTVFEYLLNRIKKTDLQLRIEALNNWVEYRDSLPALFLTEKGIYDVTNDSTETDIPQPLRLFRWDFSLCLLIDKRSSKLYDDELEYIKQLDDALSIVESPLNRYPQIKIESVNIDNITDRMKSSIEMNISASFNSESLK